MRLTDQARAAVKRAIAPLVENATEVRVFGSRLDDAARGGDLDLYIEFAKNVDHPAALSAQIAVRASRARWPKRRRCPRLRVDSLSKRLDRVEKRLELS